MRKAKEFNEQNIDFVIIGGFALQFSGISRATRDIDLLVLSQDKVISAEDQIGLKVQSSSNDPSRLSQDIADIELLIIERLKDVK